MPKVVTSQTFQQQTALLNHERVESGWSSRTKVALATCIGFAGIAATYASREMVQSILSEQYEFSSKNLVYPLLTVGLLGGLGAAGIYLWKRRTAKEVTQTQSVFIHEKVEQNVTQEISEGKKQIDEVLDQLIGQPQKQDSNPNPLTPEKLNPIFERTLNRSSRTESNSNDIKKTINTQTDTYDRLFKALIEAFELFRNPETKGYRNKNGKIEVDCTKDCQSKIKDCFDFAKTLTAQNDSLSQKLVLKAYNKLLNYSKISACKLAIACIGKPGEGCKAIVQKAFTDLVSGTKKAERNYVNKYEKAANKNAFQEQFEATSDKIMQRAVNFVIACMKRGDPECKKIIDDAFPILLKNPSLSALKFAIYCLKQPDEAYKTKVESFDIELAGLIMFEAECQEKLPGKSLIELMSRKNPNADEKDVLDFGLDDLRDFQFNSGNTLVKTSDDRSFGEDDDSSDFSKKINSILNDMNSSSEEESDLVVAAFDTKDDL